MNDGQIDIFGTEHRYFGRGQEHEQTALELAEQDRPLAGQLALPNTDGPLPNQEGPTLGGAESHAETERRTSATVNPQTREGAACQK